MNIKMKLNNPMTAIVGRVERRIDDEIHTFAKVKEDGRFRTIFVGSRIIAPNSDI